MKGRVICTQDMPGWYAGHCAVSMRQAVITQVNMHCNDILKSTLQQLAMGGMKCTMLAGVRSMLVNARLGMF